MLPETSRLVEAHIITEITQPENGNPSVRYWRFEPGKTPEPIEAGEYGIASFSATDTVRTFPGDQIVVTNAISPSRPASGWRLFLAKRGKGIIKTLDFKGTIINVAAGPDGTLLVVESEGNFSETLNKYVRLWYFDGTELRLIKELSYKYGRPVMSNDVHVAFDADGTWSTYLSVWSNETGIGALVTGRESSILTEVGLTTKPEEWSRSWASEIIGKRIARTNYAANTVELIDSTSGRALFTVPGSWPSVPGRNDEVWFGSDNTKTDSTRIITRASRSRIERIACPELSRFTSASVIDVLDDGRVVVQGNMGTEGTLFTTFVLEKNAEGSCASS